MNLAGSIVRIYALQFMLWINHHKYSKWSLEVFKKVKISLIGLSNAFLAGIPIPLYVEEKGKGILVELLGEMKFKIPLERDQTAKSHDWPKQISLQMESLCRFGVTICFLVQ